MNSTVSWSDYFKKHEHLQDQFILTDLRLSGTCESVNGFKNEVIRRFLTANFTVRNFENSKYANEFKQIMDRYEVLTQFNTICS